MAGELGVAGRVMFRDYIPDDELADYYRMADVFALSSRYEPFGMTALEAMACGVASIVTKFAGVQENLTSGINSIIADPFQTREFADTICKLLKGSKLAADIGKRGCEFVRNEFSWGALAKKSVRFYEKYI